MKQVSHPDFIVIDDDYINNIICVQFIGLVMPGASVKTFTFPEKGLEYILSTYCDYNANNAILFLDINMPVLSGWDVLDKFKNFPDQVKEHIEIFMLSSSVDPIDKEKANNNPFVSGFITKSLSEAKLRAILPKFESVF